MSVAYSHETCLSTQTKKKRGKAGDETMTSDLRTLDRRISQLKSSPYVSNKDTT
jgi:hypothetical protein